MKAVELFIRLEALGLEGLKEELWVLADDPETGRLKSFRITGVAMHPIRHEVSSQYLGERLCLLVEEDKS